MSSKEGESSSRKRRSEISDDEELTSWGEDGFEPGSGDFEGSGDFPEPIPDPKPEPIPCSELSTIQCEEFEAGVSYVEEVNETVEETSEEFVEDFKRMSEGDSNPINRWCPDPGNSTAIKVFKVGGKQDGEWLSINTVEYGELSYGVTDDMLCGDPTNGLHHRALMKIEEAGEAGEKSEKKSSKKSKRAAKESLKEIKDLPVTPKDYDKREEDMKKALKKFDDYEDQQLKDSTATASEKLANIKQHLNRDYSGCPEMTIEDYVANYEEMCPNCRPGEATYADCKAKDPCHCNFKQFDNEIEKTKALKKTADSLAAKQSELDDVLSKE